MTMTSLGLAGNTSLMRLITNDSGRSMLDLKQDFPLNFGLF